MHAREFEPAIQRLRQVGLPPTFARLAVAKLLLEMGPRASVAELVEGAEEAGLPVAADDVAAALADLRRAGLGDAAEAPDSFADEALAASTVLKAMGNPWRLRVLCLLARGEKCVGEMEAVLGLSQSALSQHLARLRQSGLIRARRHRQNIYYAVTQPALPAVLQTLCLMRGLCGGKTYVADVSN